MGFFLSQSTIYRFFRSSAREQVLIVIIIFLFPLLYILLRCFSLQSVVRFSRWTRFFPEKYFPQMDQVERVLTLLSWRFGSINTCLYRSLAAMALTGARSGNIKLVIGVRPIIKDILAHAWLEDDNRRVLLEDRQDLDEYAVLALYDEEGVSCSPISRSKNFSENRVIKSLS